MKRVLLIVNTLLLMCSLTTLSQTISCGKGWIRVRHLAPNAVRIQYAEQQTTDSLPEWIYVNDQETKDKNVSVVIENEEVVVKDGAGHVCFRAKPSLGLHETMGTTASLRIPSPKDECLYGLGQFQDGFANVRGLSRRLTQVNTQISVPMVLSNKGYGLLWNNYGLVEWNPAEYAVTLLRGGGEGTSEVVDVTSTEGGRREVRQGNVFEGTLDVAEEGDYALLLDVGQAMARRHNLSIDGQQVIEMRNLWLPPTASTIIHLTAGKHALTAELSRDDLPVLYYNKVEDQTVLRSPLSEKVDFTVFIGSPDEIIATYRQLTGTAPMMPRWALGYIHCRERFHSQEEILTTAQRFQQEGIPVDVLVQDWQYWGKYGWNAMRFDEDYYPDPRALTDSLHAMGKRLMVSVWSKIDKNSEVGALMTQGGHYIEGTDWVDFFSDSAAKAYWRHFSQRLVPLGIDAWWQDATEPENDDLMGRRVNRGRWAGEQVRNVYPLMVNKTVYEGLRHDRPDFRPMILTRCAFPGIQRYGSAMWSGDVGNDWETLRRQITAGLGMQAAGIPWWTYDAGGFFRPANQYTDEAYIERMLRWIETSVYLPLMRVHGYMSDTEPWRYGAEAQTIITGCIKERYRLLPYIYSMAAKVSSEGFTLMRPLLFDFAKDHQALAQKQEFMFGSALLVSPVTEPSRTTWETYLPKHTAGWFDYRTGQHYEGGQTITTSIDKAHIPLFVKAGSILPLGQESQSTATGDNTMLDILVFPGADASFTFYEDDGVSNDYEKGQSSRITFRWDDTQRQLVIDKRQGSFPGMAKSRQFHIVLQGQRKTVTYKGKRMIVKF
ncbi:MAG: DUF5110 domain-containing protein [Prevotella sp.]|nr:DUF5110 domain-containing protein [Prevotella sp.]